MKLSILLSLCLSASAQTVQISPVQPFTNQFTVAFTCEPGRTYTLQASTNLTHWDDVCFTTNEGTNTRAGYLGDVFFRNYQRRFYRIKIQ